MSSYFYINGKNVLPEVLTSFFDNKDLPQQFHMKLMIPVMSVEINKKENMFAFFFMFSICSRETLKTESEDKNSFGENGKQTMIITVSADDNIGEIVAWAVG